MERTQTMVRKQFLIRPEQEQALKEQARRRNTSEAALIREAIDRVIAPPVETEDDPFEAMIQGARTIRASHGFPENPRFSRSDLYAEREDRWFPRADPPSPS